MKTLVEQSVEYLSSVDLEATSVHMTNNRVLNTEILGRDGNEIRHKKRRHTQARERWPNRVLKWDSEKNDYVPGQTLNREELVFSDSFLHQELLDQMLDTNQLDEVSWRNVSVVAFGISMLMWGKTLDQRYSQQKSLGSKLKQSDDPFHQSVGAFIETDAEMMKDLRHMIVRVGGLAASGALNIDRAYKYLVKQRTKQR